MNNFTKLMAGGGLACVAALSLCAPAQAAPIPDTVSSASQRAAGSDRLIGPFITIKYGANGNDAYNLWTSAKARLGGTKGTVNKSLSNVGPSASSNVLGSGDVFTFPKMGTVGPVIHEQSGKCLTAGSMETRAYLVDCNGKEVQDFSIRSLPGEPNAQSVLVPESFAGPKNMQFSVPGLELNWGVVNTGQQPDKGFTLNNNIFLDVLKPVTPEAPDTAPLTAQVTGVNNGAKSATLSGTGEPGATVTATTPTGPVTGTIDQDGKWTLNATGLKTGPNSIPVTQTIDGKVSAPVNLTVNIEAATHAFDASVKTVNNQEKSAIIHGTGTPSAAITIGGGDGAVKVTVDKDGNWSATRTGLKLGKNNVGVAQIDPQEFKSLEIMITAADLSAKVDSVNSENKSATLSGGGEPGATITVNTPTGPLTTTVDKNGSWKLDATGLTVGENSLPVTQTIDGVKSDPITLTVIIEALETPLADPAIAGGAGILALGLAGAVQLRRRKISEQ
ncbi:Ig-like domain-containing protein [Paeniglutamicibacter sp. NPDC012692]|uniref:Ig-like domain-containing protein n=1 Tax=Paeniglutamicibacter sp. NPDC012692 TaxID=3364388 RepID=UPI0036AA3D8E